MKKTHKQTMEEIMEATNYDETFVGTGEEIDELIEKSEPITNFSSKKNYANRRNIVSDTYYEYRCWFTASNGVRWTASCTGH